MVDEVIGQLRALLEAAADGPLPKDTGDRAVFLFGQLMIIAFTDETDEARIRQIFQQEDMARGLSRLGAQLVAVGS